MIWLVLIVVAAAALLPLALGLRRAQAGRGRREAALLLHRAQLAELERDRTEGRLGAAEHASAILEVQRRLLADAALPEQEPAATHGGTRLPVLAALGVVPLLALGLYLIGGRPDLPAQPLATRLAAADRDAAAGDQLIATLRSRLAGMDQNSAVARQGYVLLGDALQGRGDLAGAAAAWREAVRIQFDPELAAATAEAQTQADGGQVSAASLDLYRRALAVAPADAPWRAIVQRRVTAAAK